MGNRNGGSRVYHMPAFFTLKQVREIYQKSNNDIQSIMKSVIPNKTNFIIHCYSGRMVVELHSNEELSNNMTSLSMILMSESSFDNIALITFHTKDAPLFLH